MLFMVEVVRLVVIYVGEHRCNLTGVDRTRRPAPVWGSTRVRCIVDALNRPNSPGRTLRAVRIWREVLSHRCHP